jgi:hypothetical protein
LLLTIDDGVDDDDDVMMDNEEEEEGMLTSPNGWAHPHYIQSFLSSPLHVQ